METEKWLNTKLSGFFKVGFLKNPLLLNKKKFWNPLFSRRRPIQKISDQTTTYEKRPFSAESTTKCFQQNKFKFGQNGTSIKFWTNFLNWGRLLLSKNKSIDRVNLRPYKRDFSFIQLYHALIKVIFLLLKNYFIFHRARAW